MIVITGGGTGLGRNLASGFYKNGARVYIVGRRSEILDKAVEEIKHEGGGLNGDIVAYVQVHS